MPIFGRATARILGLTMALGAVTGACYPTTDAFAVEAITLAGPATAPLAWPALPIEAAGMAPPVLLAANTAAAKKKPKPQPVATYSGLPWRSGMQCYNDGFEAWRGRPVDLTSLYFGRFSWDTVFSTLQSDTVARAKDRPGPLVFALAMLLPDQTFADCNRGTNDAVFKDIGKALNVPGLDDSIIRLGWEANGTTYAWSVGNQVAAYKKCYKRLANLLRKQAPKIQLEWSMRKDNGAAVGVDKLYPGNGFVDIIGVSFYDRFPTTNTQAQWNAAYMQTDKGGPRGLGTYLSFAKKKKKKLALAEWAVSDGYPGSGSIDNPFFIQKVYEFLKANAADISYESYYNCDSSDPGIYRVWPSEWNPLASAKYQQLWSQAP